MIVYRSTQPFLKLADLERGSVVAQAPSEENRVTDYPVPGVSYYYAVVDSEAVLEGTITFLTGSNTTGEALEIPLPTTAGSTPPPALPTPCRKHAYQHTYMVIGSLDKNVQHKYELNCNI